MKNKNKMKTMAIVAVMAMLIVSVIPFTESTDAAVGDGGAYSYTITYNSSAMSNSSAAISVSNMTAITTPSYSGGSISGYGSWTWNTTTGLGPFNSFYAAFDMTNGNTFVAVLNPFDLTETIDGTSISSYLSNYNIMWVLPTVYWATTSSSLTLSNDSSNGIAYAHTINGHTYNYIAIGVYEGSTTTVDGNTVLTSTSGTSPTVSQTRATFRTYAHNYTMDDSLASDSNNPAYSMQWNFYQWQLYKYCAWTLMENFNSQAVVGGGHTYGSTYVFTTGATNAMGPYAGTPMASSSVASSTGGDSVKLFIENAWGGVNEFVDGVVVNGQSGYYIDSKSTPNDANTTSTYVKYIADALPSSSGYPASIVTGNSKTWGMGGNSTSGSETTGLTDRTYTSSSADRVLYVGGGSSTNASNSVRYGLSFAYANVVFSDSASDLGSRLAFVFDAGPASTHTVSVQTNNSAYGKVNDQASVVIADVPDGAAITVSGDTITINGTTVTATPSSNNAQYTYAFTSWSVSNGDVVTGDTTITANFTATTNNYTVSIAVSPSGYGSVSQNSILNVPYGTAISSSGSTLTVESTNITATPTTADDQYTYAFASWSIPLNTVQGNMTITATFSATTNNYTVTIVSNNDDYGSVSQNSILNVPYGTAISSSGSTLTVGSTNITATPTTADDQYTYAFDSWTNGTGSVSGNTTITANFTATTNNYTVSIAVSPSGYGSVSQNSILNVPYGTAISSSGSTLTVGSTNITATPTTADDQYTYTFDSWTNGTGSVSGNTTITANFTRTTNNYTVTIVSNNGDYGSVSSGTVANVPYGTSVSTNGNVLTVGSTNITATPTTATAQYTYSFDSWSNVSATVTQDVTITANFTRATNAFTVTVVVSPSGYGTVSKEVYNNVPYGLGIQVSGNKLIIGLNNAYNTSTATPATDDTGQYTYAFASWSGVPQVPAVHSDLTITANFTRTLNYYTVTIEDDDSGYGSVAPTTVSSVPWGTSVSVNDNVLDVNGTTVTATPTTDTAQYHYSFGSWSIADNATITGDTTITANFNRAVINYTVTINSNDLTYGTVVPVGTINNVPYGSVIDINGNDLTVNGTTVTATEASATVQYVYTFDGYSVQDGTTITADLTITASFSSAIRTYIVILTPNNSDYGSVSLNQIEAPYGTGITVNGDTVTINNLSSQATPNQNTSQYTYAFVNWTNNGVPVQSGTVDGEMTLTANFTRTTNNYTVTITANNFDYGTLNETSLTVPYGTRITISQNTMTVGSTNVVATPTANTPEWSYRFVSWSVANDYEVTGNLNIVATFDRSESVYDVSFAVNDATYGEVDEITVSNVPYNATFSVLDNTITINGTTVTATPKAQTAQYTFAFTSWSVSNGDAVTGDTTVTATFTPTLRNYTVTIQVNDATYGEVDENMVSAVPYGTTITANDNVLDVNGTTVTATPKAQTAQYTFAFTSWSIGDSAQLTGDMTVTATFTPTLRNYTVTISTSPNGYGSVSPGTVANVPYGTIITESTNTLNVNGTTVTATPKTADDHWTYAFDSWDDVAPVTGDMTVTAVFDRELTLHEITIVPNNANYGSVSPGTVANVPYGTTITANDNVLDVNGTTVTATPTTASNQYTYTFDSWEGVPVTVNGDMTITAAFTADLRNYTITWMEDADTTIDTTTVPYGTTPTHDVPVREGFAFAGWSPTPEPVVGDATYTAQWVELVAHTITFDATTNGGNLNGPSTKVVYNGLTYGTLPGAGKMNFGFLGWFTAPEGGTEVTADDIVLLESDITLYAHFELSSGLSPSKAIAMIIPVLLIVLVIKQIVVWRQY